MFAQMKTTVNSCFTYLVAWNAPASLGNELGGSLVDIWAGGGNLVLE